MKLLDRYIFSEMAKIFTLSLFILMSILILEKINFISNMSMGSAVSVDELSRLIVYTSPAFLVISIPLSALLASLISFSRMSADNEVIAMRASGVSFVRTLLPVAALSVICFLFTAWLALSLLHKGNYLFNSKIASYVSNRISTALGERVFFDKFPNTIIYVDEKPAGQDVMKRVFIYDGSNVDMPRFITAEAGSLGITSGDNITLKLTNGSIYSGDKNSYRVIKYGGYEMFMDIGAGRRKAFAKGEREMSSSEIWGLVQERHAKKMPAYGEEVELYKRFTMPLACLALGLLGAPLGVQVHRGGKWGGIGMGILMIVVNYVLLMVCESLGRQGNLHPLLAMLMPNIIMGFLAAYLISRVSREVAPFNFLLWLQDVRRKVAGIYWKKSGCP